jgi:hypothetical protein
MLFKPPKLFTARFAETVRFCSINRNVIQVIFAAASRYGAVCAGSRRTERRKSKRAGIRLSHPLRYQRRKRNRAVNEAELGRRLCWQISFPLSASHFGGTRHRFAEQLSIIRHIPKVRI